MRSTVIILALLAAACSGNTGVYELTGNAIGTSFSIKIARPAGSLDLDELAEQVSEVIDDVDASMSTWRDDSELSAFNANTSIDWVPVSRPLCEIVSRAQQLAHETGGALDVTVGPLVNLWGFGPAGSRSEPPAPAQIDAVADSVGFRMLQADCSQPALRKQVPSLYVDLSAVAKGHAVDRVATLLDAANIDNYLVEIGGELRARGVNAKQQAWAIAIEKPIPGGRGVQTIVPLSNAAMATSGDYRNFFEYDGRIYSHTIDPRTARPVMHDAASVTV
ncbi:MAG: FAD:protein FMN transferase, partial [Woeseiaceae bacterium]|nr:FAD:protein FMN transferase [Woeseiaceae bacterium]